MTKQITHLLSVFFVVIALAVTPVLMTGAEEELDLDDLEIEVMEAEMEVEEDVDMEVDEDVVDFDLGEELDVDVEDYDEDFTQEEIDAFNEFDEFEDDDFGYDEEGDMTVVIVVLAIVALGLVVFLVTRKR